VICVQFSQHPTNGSTVGFFGVFDGENLQHTALHRAEMPALCSLFASPFEVASLEMPDDTHLHSNGVCCAGHGGPGAAAYVQENLWKTLQSHDKFDADIKQALGAIFPLQQWRQHQRTLCFCNAGAAACQVAVWAVSTCVAVHVHQHGTSGHLRPFQICRM
jgi:hypothetical protein